jgi:hypothetical protein
LYVAENGNDTTNNGSIGQPYLTISKALSMQDQFAYTTIYVAPGIYAENLYIAYPRLSIIGLINDTYRRQGVTLSGSGITTPLITYDPSGSGKNSISNFITVIENILDKVDHMIIGGGMTFTFIKAFLRLSPVGSAVVPVLIIFLVIFMLVLFH